MPHSRRILIIEDEQDISRIVRDYLNKTNMTRQSQPLDKMDCN